MICWGKYLWYFGGYFHFSKSQICHPTYPMSPPITFRPWMDKLCENKFLGANSASPALLTSSKVPPEASQKGAKVWRGRHMRRPFERHLWICLWGAGASQDGQWLQQQQKENTCTKMASISSTSPTSFLQMMCFWEEWTLSGNFGKFSITSPL